MIRAAYGQAPIALCTVPWIFNARSLTGVGTIAGTRVPCVSAETQLQMHTGYDLPPHHERDLERLRGLVAAASPDDRA